MGTLFIFVVVIIVIVIYSLLKSIKKPSKFPPGPYYTPWMGNTIQLRKDAKKYGGQHIVFEKWAQEYKSDILGLKLGKELVVVVLSYPLVREVHLREVFEGRPDNFFLRLRTMGTRLGITCTDGELWIDHRNFVTRHLRQVGFGRTPMEECIEREVNSLLEFVECAKEEPIWPGSFLAYSVMSILWTLTAGKRIKRDDPHLEQLLDLLKQRSKVFDLCGGVLAQFPWLRYFAPNKTGYNLIKQLNKELHEFFSKTIEDHKNCLSAVEGNADLIFAYIREMNIHSKTDKKVYNETQLTMTILDLFIAGSQTTSNTIDLAIIMLAIRPDLQNLLYEECSKNLKKNVMQFPHLSARKVYPYMDSFIMEVQRYFHITPLTGPRRTLRNTTLGGYDIPKNTTILIGLRAVHMDKQHWGDPTNFRPERFMDTNGKIIKDEYFMPFGQGRRRCLGDSLARACLFSFLVKIVHSFKIETLLTDIPSLDLQPGITLSPKPYKVKFVKRS